MTVALAPTPVLETERLILRAPQASDCDAARAFLQSDRARYVGGPYTEDAAWRAFGHVIGHWVMRGWGEFVFCDKASGRPLGHCGPWFPIAWPEPEIGWCLWSAEDEGRGLVREAAQAARAHAFGVLGWETAVSYIDPANARSIALAERLGARRDAQAALPALDGWAGTLVYRHPRPEARPA